MAYIPSSGSVVSFEGGSWSTSVQSGNASVIVLVQGSVATTTLANQSVSGTIGASIIGQLPAGTAMIGSVVAYQGAIPWTISSVYGNVSGSIAGTYANSNVASTVTGVAMMFKQNISTSIMTEVSPTFPLPITGAVAASISGSVTINPPSVYGNISGSVVAFQGTSPWVVNFQNSSILATPVGSTIAVIQGSSLIGVVTGSVLSIQSGTRITSIVSSTPSSVLVGASIFGQLPAGTAPLGSVATLQGTNPWVIVGSVYGNVSGSVVAFEGGAWSTSIIGGASVFQAGTWNVSVMSTVPSSLLTGIYAQRNDTVASFLGADLTWRPYATDSAGRTLIKPFSADESRLDTTSSTVSTSVTALFNSVVGLRSYVTDIMVANTGASATLITFKDGSTSVLGYTIAPAGGGSNINGMAFPMRTAPAQDFTYTVATATSVLYITAKGYKAP